MTNIYDNLLEDTSEDLFFVGEGNKNVKPPNFVLGVEDTSKRIINDLDRYGQFIPVEDYEKIYKERKKFVLESYDYVNYKSSLISVPVKEWDLVISEEDKIYLHALREVNLDYYAVNSVAVLSAYADMGIREVKFRHNDYCELCSAADGTILFIDVLIDRILNNGFPHGGCDCSFFPVIRREREYNRDIFDIDEFVVEDPKKMFINIPVEVISVLKGLEIPHDFIEFVYMPMFVLDNGLGHQDAVVFVDSDNVLFVHNSYVHNQGPVDFLLNYCEMLNKIPDFDTSEVFFYRGKKVIESGGSYWDIETKKRVK